MSRRLIVLHARVSENTPRDLRGVELLTELASERFEVEPTLVEGRKLPFGRTPWQDDLAASREVLERTAGYLRDAVTASTGPSLALATDCALALATLPVVARTHPEARVLWLDAHCDFDTPETTTLGFLGCMSLAGACGRWESGFGPAFPERQVVLCGTRPKPDDFDIAAQRAVESSEVTLVGVSESTVEEILAALEGYPVYVHLDPDVLDPSVFPAPYGRPGGLSAQALQLVLEAVAERSPILGVEVTAFHAPEDARVRTAVARLLIDGVTVLVGAYNGGTDLNQGERLMTDISGAAGSPA